MPCGKAGVSVASALVGKLVGAFAGHSIVIHFIQRVVFDERRRQAIESIVIVASSYGFAHARAGEGLHRSIR